jgi:hypothetical protein
MKTSIVKLKQLAVMTGIALSGVGGSGSVTPANALSFNFTSQDSALQAALNASPGGTSQQALAADGFRAAGSLWSSFFTDSVTVNIDIGFKNLNTPTNTTTLALAGSNTQKFSYQNFYNHITSDAILSTDDNIAINSLSNGTTFNMLINRTTYNSGGYYIDNDNGANNQNIELTLANAKALGLRSANDAAIDASITFNDQFTWDFDRSNGISGGYDFVGIAAHELGHSLGFISGVDVLDENDNNTNPQDDNYFSNVTALDLFRYSTDSSNLGVIDFTADSEDKYFSFDGGATKIASFSTGVNFGDGRQAGHFKDSPLNTTSIGIMDPTFGSGELAAITTNDLRAFDVIGWNRSAASYATSVPEPSNVVGTLMVAAFGAKMVLKRRKKRLEPTAKQTEE